MTDNFNEFYFQNRIPESKRRRTVWKQVTIFLKKHIKGTVLDAGCGHADFLRFSNCQKKIGVDVFKSSEFPGDAQFVKSSIEDMGRKLKKSSADVVFASNLLEHLNDEQLESAVTAVKQVLAKNGVLILMQPNFKYYYRNYFDDYTHKKIFTEISLCDFLRSKGFEIVKVYPKFLPGALKSRFPSWSFLVWMYLRSPIKPFAGQMLVVARKK